MSVNMSVTLTITETPASLFSLLADINPNAPRSVAKLLISGDVAQDSLVYIGDSQVADDNFAYQLTDNTTEPYKDEDQGGMNSISTTQVYLKVKDEGGTQDVHCQVRCF